MGLILKQWKPMSYDPNHPLSKRVDFEDVKDRFHKRMFRGDFNIEYRYYPEFNRFFMAEMSQKDAKFIPCGALEIEFCIQKFDKFY